MPKRRLPATERRVAEHTRPEINAAIGQRTRERVAYYAAHPDEIDERLRQLEREWDMERLLETNAAGVTLLSLLLGRRSRVFSMVPPIVAGFLLQHALQGWCPPVPLFRRLGVRTTREINAERYALKALRGDMADVASDETPHAAAAALEAAGVG